VTDLAVLNPLAVVLIADCKRQKLKIATAESCTGGLVAGALTEIPGSSAVVDRGFVAYSNPAKTEMLGVDAALIARDGAVSQSVACAMAEGALTHSAADLAVAITGIAGPDGGTAEKPVGLVHFAAVRRGKPTVHRERRFTEKGRSAIRLAAAREALELLRSLL
jgi:nicotinamide-nucleotide amidase